MSKEKLSFLAIDDSIADVCLIKSLLRQSRSGNFDFEHCKTAEAGMLALGDGEYDCLFLDYMLEETDGLDVLKDIRAAGYDLPVITLSGCGNEQVAVDALKLGAQDYIVKGGPDHELTFSNLERAIGNAIGKVNSERELKAHQQELAQKNQQLNEMLEQQNTMLSQLAMEKLRAEEANAAKTEFLARATHELRTPLHAIIGFSSNILAQAETHPLSEYQEDRLKRVHKGGEDLLALVDRILDLSQMETQDETVSQKTFELQELFEEVASMTEALIDDQPDLELQTRWPDSLPTMTSDRAKVKQIMINLLGNAAKYTDTGTITLTVEANSEGISVQVQDTGIGIPAESVENLFDMFYRVDRDESASRPGTGLGLSITKQFVELLGGKISVTSELGVGTCFHLELPLVSPCEGQQTVQLQEQN